MIRVRKLDFHAGHCLGGYRRLALMMLDADVVAVSPSNEVRLHSVIGCVTPADKMDGRDRAIFAERDRKLDAARERSKAARLPVV
jgi:hypothetical protein